MLHLHRSTLFAAILTLAGLPALAADNPASQPASRPAASRPSASQPASRPSASQPAATAPAATQSSAITAVRTRVAEAIKLLEAHDNVKFIRNFAPPKLLADLTREDGALEAFAKRFDGQTATDALARLKLTATETPTVNDAGDTVTFNAAVDTRPMVFNKIEGVWYIGN